MMSHTASTTISRYFTKSRGKALSGGWFGLSTAEFILPVLLVYLLTFIDWRDLYVSFSLIVIILLPIFSFFLIKNLNLDSREINDNKTNDDQNIKQWKRIEVIKDYRFYIICMNMFAMPSIATGVFVYQSFITSSKEWGSYVIAQSFMSYSIFSVITLILSGFLIDKFTSRRLLIYMNIPLLISTFVLIYFDAPITSFILESKGWGPYVIAQSFMSYSLLSVITLFVSGFLIDKFTSRKLLIYMNIPLLISTFVLIYFDAPITSFIFLGLVGISNGWANVLGSSLWAEMYGVKYIGSIKALSTALMVFASAFGTAIFGIFIDYGFSIEEIAIVSGIYIFLSIVLLFFIRKKLNPVLI